MRLASANGQYAGGERKVTIGYFAGDERNFVIRDFADLERNFYVGEVLGFGAAEAACRFIAILLLPGFPLI